ncbi:MAG: hypothetical protein LIP03_08285 [Bacteroidales bacterium]|nr:hypothetical protein [Bacteroidales bacterium]
MNSSRNVILPTLLAQSQTVFSCDSVRLLLGSTPIDNISWNLNYYAKNGWLVNPRRGFYAKPNYNPEELANKLITPSYLSLTYMLQKYGMIFQYSETITAVSYLSRMIPVDNFLIEYRRIKEIILIDPRGIEQRNGISYATPERAFLDTLYLNSNFTFDNLSCIDKGAVEALLPIYSNKSLNKRVASLIKI